MSAAPESKPESHNGARPAEWRVALMMFINMILMLLAGFAWSLNMGALTKIDSRLESIRVENERREVQVKELRESVMRHEKVTDEIRSVTSKNQVILESLRVVLLKEPPRKEE